jgi:hypothetical protein
MEINSQLISLKEENDILIKENIKLSEQNIKFLEYNLKLIEENHELIESKQLEVTEEVDVVNKDTSKGTWKGINTDMIFIDNYIESVNNNDIKFNILYFDKNNIKSSYHIQETTLEGGNIFILRLYERKFHYLNEPKTKKEYELLSEYFMKFYYYGCLKIGLIDYNYIITPTYDNNILIHNLTNSQKYTFLINNLKFLDKLQKNNMIYPDYKFQNIAWTSDLNIVLINYDSESLQLIDNNEENKSVWKDRKKEKNIFNMSDEMLLKFFKIDSKNENYENDKTSIEALKELINILNIQYTFKFKNNIPLPADALRIVSSRCIGRLSPGTILIDLNLDLENNKYNLIPTYDELICVFEWLHKNEFIVL